MKAVPSQILILVSTLPGRENYGRGRTRPDAVDERRHRLVFAKLRDSLGDSGRWEARGDEDV